MDAAPPAGEPFDYEIESEPSGGAPGGSPYRADDLRAADLLERLPRVFDIFQGSEVELARIIAAWLRRTFGGDVVFAEGQFWVYARSVWEPLSEKPLRMIVHDFDGRSAGPRGTPLKISKKMIDGVLHELSTILSEASFFDHPAIGLNVRNGFVTINPSGGIEIVPHGPEHRSRFTIEADFTLTTEMSPPAGSMLRQLLDGAFGGDSDAADKVNLVGEILASAAFGYATRLPKPKAFVFLGETAANGKSTIASLLSRLLPVDSVSAIPPSAFGDERRIVNLAGKAANVADELSATAIAGETFKAAVTGNPIEGRDLYRSAVSFVPRALHLFTTNALPRFNGGLDRGLQRRLVVLTFTRTIPESEIVADIADRIARDELDLLLGFAVAGAQRLVRRRAYTHPPSSLAALQGWLMLDPVNEWIAARTTIIATKPPEGWMTSGQLYADFKSWATSNGHVERFLPPVNTFSQRLKTVQGVRIERRGDGRFAAGIVLGKPSEVTDDFDW